MSSFDISQYTIEVSMDNDMSETIVYSLDPTTVTQEKNEEAPTVKEVRFSDEMPESSKEDEIFLKKEEAIEDEEIIFYQIEKATVSTSIASVEAAIPADANSESEDVVIVENEIISISIDTKVETSVEEFAPEEEEIKDKDELIQAATAIYPSLEKIEVKVIQHSIPADEKVEKEAILQDEIISLEEVVSLPDDISVRTFTIPEPAEDHEPWNRWLFTQLKHVWEARGNRIAIVEEIGETRCISYGELMDGVMKTANYLKHHDVNEGTVVGFCMESSFEFVLYELACFFLGILPVLFHPSHIASDRVARLNVKVMIVDADHYGHVLRGFEFFGSLEKIFILADDLTTLYIPKNVWIYDGFGFLDFNCDLRLQLGNSGCNVIAFATSGISSSKGKIVAHTAQSCKAICTHYYTELTTLLKEKNPEETTNVHLVSTGLHTIDGFSYSIYSLIHGGTLLLTETNADVWKVSFLDRVAGLIERYRIPMLMVHSQFLKCFSKYEIHKIYNVESLKLLCHSGSCLTPAVLQQVRDLGMSITQAYITTETGAFSVEEVTTSKDMISTCGEPFLGNNILQLDGEEEVSPGKWGRLWVQGPTLFSEYLCEAKFTEDCSGGWFFTGDFASQDEQARLFVAGPVDGLATGTKGNTVPLVKVEGVLAEISTIDDVAVCKMKEELVAGIVITEGEIPPSVEQINLVLKGKGIKLMIDRTVIVDFIPRSETGKLVRSDLPFLFEIEPEFEADVASGGIISVENVKNESSL